jgi:hypothetical protein
MEGRKPLYAFFRAIKEPQRQKGLRSATFLHVHVKNAYNLHREYFSIAPVATLIIHSLTSPHQTPVHHVKSSSFSIVAHYSTLTQNPNRSLDGQYARELWFYCTNVQILREIPACHGSYIRNSGAWERSINRFIDLLSHSLCH